TLTYYIESTISTIFFFRFCILPLPLFPTLFPYTTLFRSHCCYSNTHRHKSFCQVARTNFTHRRSSQPTERFSVNPESQSFPLSGDRKSTRLNSSHVSISYAVFCLKKKINT